MTVDNSVETKLASKEENTKIPEFTRRVLIPKEQILVRNRELAKQIAKDYEGEDVIAIIVLNGAMIFGSNLLIETNGHSSARLFLDTMRAKSYNKTERGKLEITKDNELDVKGKKVLLIEDIVDSGHTINSLKNHLMEKGAEEIKVCALLSKPSRREVEVHIDYLGFEIDNIWVEGYGLDTDEENRFFPDIMYRDYTITT